MHRITQLEAKAMQAIGHIVQVDKRRRVVVINGMERYRLEPALKREKTANQSIRESSRQ
jgi:hypothetical protein